MGSIRKALEKGDLEHPGSACCTDDMLEIFVRFGRCLCCLLPLFVNGQLHTNSLHGLLLPLMHHNDFWDVSKWLVGAYKVSTSHLDQQQTPVLIRDDKIKWLDFGTTPDPENLQPHPGFVWVKSGYSEAIAWRKVPLTKQRNVDLTTDSLWAMPLNTGWVLVKARRLQDWGKLKKYVPIHKHGVVCPKGVPALVERGNDDNDLDSDKSGMAFSHRFQKVRTSPHPQRDDILAHWTENSENLEKLPKRTELAHSELPLRDMQNIFRFQTTSALCCIWEIGLHGFVEDGICKNMHACPCGDACSCFFLGVYSFMVTIWL